MYKNCQMPSLYLYKKNINFDLMIIEIYVLILFKFLNLNV